ncbi:hypothetical protein D3C81_1133660 [compost metagenome]
MLGINGIMPGTFKPVVIGLIVLKILDFIIRIITWIRQWEIVEFGYPISIDRMFIGVHSFGHACIGIFSHK